MSEIRILPDEISNRIAAGEVVERPASVVKELVENSLDAGAKSISIRIDGAGRKLIGVVDDGVGMDSDDALLCFEPHATSKINSPEHIDRITTMGFRGEALPSVASIARVRLLTRKHDVLEGCEVVVEGGRFISSSPAGCAPGTEITVRDLFFNTPARRKFLRSDHTEEKHISDIVCHLALANFGVAFELSFDGAVAFISPPDDSPFPRIREFLGKTMSDAFTPVDYERAGIRITGYIARHGFTRKSRREQRVFLNSRPIEAQEIYRGLRNGYESLVMKGSYPPVALYIEMAPDRVDVNVHPAKREVRFRESALVVSIIADAVRETLRSVAAPTVAVTPELSLDSILRGASIDYNSPTMEQTSLPSLVGGTPIPEIIPELPADQSATFDSNRSLEALSSSRNSFLESATDNTVSQAFDATGERESLDTSAQGVSIDSLDAGRESRGPATLPVDDFALRIIGFLDDTYILAASESGLVVIDQHAAHERVLFEKLMSVAERDVPTSQRLLIPVTLDLAIGEVAFLMKSADVLDTLGFELEPFGRNTIIVHAIPAALSDNDADALILDILHTLLEDGVAKAKPDKAAVASAACRRAVKARDSLTAEEAAALIAQMGRCKLPYSCPHGRPTIISISYKELEKRFGRK
ncbi:MAG: DNA mismatch repair endonuclease MutL [Victivallales bacterium]|nr:DNA mismatch repair endonuclease MutL [Victivallales bacterium]